MCVGGFGCSGETHALVTFGELDLKKRHQGLFVNKKKKTMHKKIWKWKNASVMTDCYKAVSRYHPKPQYERPDGLVKPDFNLAPLQKRSTKKAERL